MSTTRDPELEALQAELKGEPTPYIESPLEKNISDGSACWLDKDRACDSDCRAYDTGVSPAQGPEVCVILSSVMDFGDSMKPFIEVAALLKKTTQDKVRTAANHAPVPDPTGGKRP